MNDLVQNNSEKLVKYDLESNYTNTLSESTKRVYIATILEFFNEKRLSDISIEQMQSVDVDMANRWLIKMKKNNLKEATINKKASALKNLYKFLCRRNVGIMDYNPFDTDEGALRYKNAEKTYSDHKTLSKQEIADMVKAASSYKGVLGARNKLLFCLMISTGMRREEVVNIKLGDFFISDGKHVVNIIGKGRKHRQCLISNDVYTMMLAYIDMRGLTLKDKDVPLFVSHSSNGDCTVPMTDATIYRVIKDCAKSAGIDDQSISPHTLRHTYATMGYLKGDLDIKQLKDLMGHSSITTTNRYIHAISVLKDSPAEIISEMFNEGENEDGE